MGFAFIDSLELWDDAMVTLSLVLVATIIALAVSVPLGIWAARSDRVSAVVRPVLDFLQTLPAMIYLIPAILFFGTGASAGIVATLIFALAPGVRMTELGIRQVDKELVEAAEAFGTTPRDTLLRVQLPLALPTVMAGVNQVIMLGLSMAAIAGMVGTGGLGGDVNEAIGQLDVGLGSEAGVAIVILAICLDRMTGSLGAQVSPLGRRAAARVRAAQGLRIWSYRPRPQIAVVGIVVLALVGAGMSVFGGRTSTAVADGTDVGRGRRSPSATSPGTKASPPPSCGRRSFSSAASGSGPSSWRPDRCTPPSRRATSTSRSTPGCPPPTSSTGRSTATVSTTSAPGTPVPRWSWPCRRT